jgi:hypothetical protein
MRNKVRRRNKNVKFVGRTPSVRLRSLSAHGTAEQATSVWLALQNSARSTLPQPFATRAGVTRFSIRSKNRAVKVSGRRPVARSIRRTRRYLTPTAARSSEVNSLHTRPAPHAALKAQGVWHARSVRGMLHAERRLSAWAPQMSTRNRRRHFPRVNGIPTRRRRLSFRARRDRRLDNFRRLQRGVPQIRYINYAPRKLQYYYGSVASAGYVRFRRVHRMHSKFSRW